MGSMDGLIDGRLYIACIRDSSDSYSKKEKNQNKTTKNPAPNICGQIFSFKILLIFLSYVFLSFFLVFNTLVGTF